MRRLAEKAVDGATTVSDNTCLLAPIGWKYSLSIKTYKI